MKKLKLANTEIAFTRHGKGCPLVLLHGFPLDHQIWNNVIPLLENDFEIVTPDLRGFGQSQALDARYSLSDLAEDITHLPNHLGMEKAVVAGHSMGGYVALAFAKSYADKLVAKRVGSIRSQVADAPSVYLVHGDLTDREISTLFRHIKVKAFISLTHGEGLMISGLQFSLSGKPLILPGYSGHLDYLFPGHPTMKVEMTPVPPSGLPPGMIGAGAVWGTVPDRTAVEAMRAVFMDFPRAHALGQAQKSHVERTWTREAVRGRFIATLNQHLREVPFEEEIDHPVTSHTQEEVS